MIIELKREQRESKIMRKIILVCLSVFCAAVLIQVQEVLLSRSVFNLLW